MTPTPSPQSTAEAKITPEEMIEMFGDEMPIEAVNLVYNADGSKTCGQLRAELRAIAAALQSTDEVAALMAENERLRQVLGRIAEMTDIEADFDGFEARHIAREALSLISGEGVR